MSAYITEFVHHWLMLWFVACQYQCICGTNVNWMSVVHAVYNLKWSRKHYKMGLMHTCNSTAASGKCHWIKNGLCSCITQKIKLYAWHPHCILKMISWNLWRYFEVSTFVSAFIEISFAKNKELLSLSITCAWLPYDLGVDKCVSPTTESSRLRTLSTNNLKYATIKTHTYART